MTAELRNQSIKIRLTTAELAELNRIKTRPELARWVREIALEYGENTSKKGEKTQKKIKKNSSLFPPEIARILAGMGNNLNQIAKQLNSTTHAQTIENTQLIRYLAEISAAERSLTALRDYLANEQNGGKS